MNIGGVVNQVLHRIGLHVAKHSDPGRISWILKNLDTSPSALCWIAPGIIREHGLKTFVQVGANDGEMSDPIQKCIQECALHGVMVEPQPKQCALLRKKYAGVERIIIDQVAISNSEGFLTLYYFDTEQVLTRGAKEIRSDVLTSGDCQHMERLRDSLGQTGAIQEMKVPALTWKGLLNKHALQNPDMVIVDTEGMDDTIVNQIELGESSPAIIQFEHMHIDSNRLAACTERLFDAGYRFVTSEFDVLCLHSKIWKA